MERPSNPRPGLIEAVVVGGAAASATIAVFVTYSRFSPDRLYHFSKSGISGGAGRALVFLNFPIAFIALAILPIAVTRVLAVVSRAQQRVVGVVATLGAALCLVAALPGVVNQNDFDPRPVNALPAIGVVLVAAIGIAAVRRNGITGSRRWRGVDTAGTVLGCVLLFLGLPWVLANAGVYAEDVPGLGAVFESKEVVTDTLAGDVPVVGNLFEAKHVVVEREVIQVHLGDHHGFDGLFFALSALALARVVGTLAIRWLDRALSWYLAFMLVYGIANLTQDFWGEQIVKRGWATYDIPTMYRPELRPVWGLIVLSTIAVWFVAFYRPATHRPRRWKQITLSKSIRRLAKGAG